MDFMDKKVCVIRNMWNCIKGHDEDPESYSAKALWVMHTVLCVFLPWGQISDVLRGSKEGKLKETGPEMESLTFLDVCLSHIYDTNNFFRETGWKIPLYRFEVFIKLIVIL